MKSIDLRHRLAAVLLAVCLVVCCALPAFATSANILLGRLGSLHVRLYDTHNDVPLRGGELTLYQVASVKRTNGNLYFDYTGDFAGGGVVLFLLLALPVIAVAAALSPAGILADSHTMKPTGEAMEVWERLPDDLPMERRMVVTYALALVDKVDYFWAANRWCWAGTTAGAN